MPSKGKKLELVAGGDVMIRRKLPGKVFHRIRPILSRADLRFCNLEAPLSSRGDPVLVKPVTLRSPPEVADELREAGFDIVSLANNHILDYGFEGLVDTLELLGRKGISVSGAGIDLRTATKPVVLAKSGFSVAFLSYCSAFPSGFAATPDRPGLAGLRAQTAYEPQVERMLEQAGVPLKVRTWAVQKDLDQLVTSIGETKKKVDRVVISLHWGVAFEPRPVEYQQQIAHAAIDAGADLVLGHHPHILQGVEVYRERPICYSLSNLVFDYSDPRFGTDSLLVECTFLAAGAPSLVLMPISLDSSDGRPYIANAKTAKRIFLEMSNLSSQFGTMLSYDRGCRRIVLQRC